MTWGLPTWERQSPFSRLPAVRITRPNWRESNGGDIHGSHGVMRFVMLIRYSTKCSEGGSEIHFGAVEPVFQRGRESIIMQRFVEQVARTLEGGKQYAKMGGGTLANSVAGGNPKDMLRVRTALDQLKTLAEG
jgi:hypothetical protein